MGRTIVSMMMNAAFFCYAVSAFMVLGFGLIYLLRTRFMPYHAVALGREWAEVPTEYQILILALQRCLGGGFVAAAVFAFALLLGPFRTRETWALWVTPAGLLIVAAGSLFAMRGVRTKTAAKPPYQLVMGAGLLTVFGLALSLAA